MITEEKIKENRRKQQSIGIQEPWRTQFIQKYPRMLSAFVNKAIKKAVEKPNFFIEVISYFD